MRCCIYAFISKIPISGPYTTYCILCCCGCHLLIILDVTVVAESMCYHLPGNITSQGRLNRSEIGRLPKHPLFFICYLTSFTLCLFFTCCESVNAEAKCYIIAGGRLLWNVRNVPILHSTQLKRQNPPKGSTSGLLLAKLACSKDPCCSFERALLARTARLLPARGRRGRNKARSVVPGPV